jgi:hypothetical protein
MRGGQIKHRQRTRAERLDLGERLPLESIAHAARRTDPDCTGIFDHRQQRGGEPAGHRFIRSRAGHAIGDDNEVHSALLI